MLTTHPDIASSLLIARSFKSSVFTFKKALIFLLLGLRVGCDICAFWLDTFVFCKAYF